MNDGRDWEDPQLWSKDASRLLQAAASDGPSPLALRRTAAALGVPMAALTGIATHSTAAAASSHAAQLTALQATTTGASATASSSAVVGGAGAKVAALGAGTGSVLTAGVTTKIALVTKAVAGLALWGGATVTTLHVADTLVHAPDAPASPTTAAAPATPQASLTLPSPHGTRQAEDSAPSLVSDEAPPELKPRPEPPSLIERGSRHTASKPATSASARSAGETELVSPQLELELAQLAASRAALRAGDATRCLKLLKGYRANFPTGALAAEAEVLEIDALATLGRTDEARTQAERLAARAPDSPHLRRLTRSGLLQKPKSTSAPTNMDE